jgi:hypothetical protein
MVRCKRRGIVGDRFELGGVETLICVEPRWKCRHSCRERAGSTLVRLKNPCAVNPQCGRSTATVSEPAGDSTYIHAGRDQLGGRVVAKLMDVHVPTEPRACWGILNFRWLSECAYALGCTDGCTISLPYRPARHVQPARYWRVARVSGWSAPNISTCSGSSSR